MNYEEKSELNHDNNWTSEVERRLSLKENKVKFVEIEMVHNSSQIMFTIEDQGNGFEWENYMDISPERAIDTHGRGIAMACVYSFDTVKYFGKGNIVTATVFL